MIQPTVLFLLLVATPMASLHAQSEPAEAADAPAAAEDPAEKPVPCTAEPFRQFDFWIGEWDVHTAAGGEPALNSIASLHGGCVLRESYTNKAYSGMSMNWYDEAAGTWNQLWIDNQGLVLRLEGAWNGESMVLANDQSRITWTPAEDGSVRQLWEQTDDGGETWKVIFDGKYVRRGADG